MDEGKLVKHDHEYGGSRIRGGRFPVESCGTVGMQELLNILVEEEMSGEDYGERRQECEGHACELVGGVFMDSDSCEQGSKEEACQAGTISI